MYKRRLPSYSPHLLQVVDIISLAFNGTTNQHEPSVEVAQTRAIYMQSLINVAEAQGQPIVARMMHYFSFVDTSLSPTVGWYVEDEQSKRWLIKEVVPAGLAGSRVLCRVEAV